MKKIQLFALMGLMGGLLAACGTQTGDFDASKGVKLISRAAGSGTRECFFESIGYKDVAKEDKWEANVVVTTQQTNPDMMQAVKNEPYALGYCSLDSLSSVRGIKGLSYLGVTASVASVMDGTYKISRNFNYAIRAYEDENSANSLATHAYVEFLTKSIEGYSAIVSAGGILGSDQSGLKPWSELASKYAGLNENAVEIKTCGSTSVQSVLEKTSAKFSSLTGGKVTFKMNQQSSGAAIGGITATSGDLYDIGFLSREIKDEEAAKLTDKNLRGSFCKDAVVPIVNGKNTALDNITDKILVSLYKGEITTWADAAKALA